MEQPKTRLQRAVDRANAKREAKDEKGLRYLLADERGRWFLMRLFERCHMLDTTFPQEDHTNRMLVYEGERRVALRIQHEIMAREDIEDSMEQARREYNAFWRSEQAVINAIDQEEKEQGNEPYGI